MSSGLHTADSTTTQSGCHLPLGLFPNSHQVPDTKNECAVLLIDSSGKTELVQGTQVKNNL